MFALWVAVSGFRIVVTPVANAAFSHDAFSIFESCKEVSEVCVCESEASLFTVSAMLVLTDDTRLSVRGVSRQKERAYQVASASALYALHRHRRREEFETCFTNTKG